MSDIDQEIRDSKRGMKNSWFVEVRVRIEYDGHTVEPTAVMRRHDEHGESKTRCAGIAHAILLKGEIDLKYWRVDHY